MNFNHESESFITLRRCGRIQLNDESIISLHSLVEFTPFVAVVVIYRRFNVRNCRHFYSSLKNNIFITNCNPLSVITLIAPSKIINGFISNLIIKVVNDFVRKIELKKIELTLILTHF